MLIFIQLHVKTPPEILTRFMTKRCISLVSAVSEAFEDVDAEIIMNTLSSYFLSQGYHHRVTIYNSTAPSSILILRLFDTFPPDLTSQLVSILATQEVTPPLLPRDTQSFVGEI